MFADRCGEQDCPENCAKEMWQYSGGIEGWEIDTTLRVECSENKHIYQMIIWGNMLIILRLIIYISIKYIMNITLVSTLSTPCTPITIQSIGDSKYVHDGGYQLYLFGTYNFVSIDARGNAIYHANIQGTDMFLTKNMDNYWVVNITILRKVKCML